jgi:hypothetical protein
MAEQRWLPAITAIFVTLTYLAVTFLKRAEREDFFDRETNFNPLRWRE